MANRNIVGYGLLGLGLGIFLFAVVYFLTVKARPIAERTSPTWTVIFLALILGPAVLFALWGASKKTDANL